MVLLNLFVHHLRFKMVLDILSISMLLLQLVVNPLRILLRSERVIILEWLLQSIYHLFLLLHVFRFDLQLYHSSYIIFHLAILLVSHIINRLNILLPLQY